MDRVDFRSDTVTWPTPAMRKAMAKAPVGDDVYGEDPTVNELERLSAEMLGKESALFVASGTMANLVAILSHAERGDEAIGGEDAHTLNDEAGGMAVLGGIMPRPLPTDIRGKFDLALLSEAIRPDDYHYPRTKLILLENTYTNKGGVAIEPAYFNQVGQFAAEKRLVTHLDGSRIFNAAAALDVEAAVFVQGIDSVSFCLSKGLCAPVGSMVCGSSEFISRARRVRKIVGGGMRQAGIIAAAGIIALNEMTCRLSEDHKTAKRLAAGLQDIPGISLRFPLVETNMVFFDLESFVVLSNQDVVRRLSRDYNIDLGTDGPRGFRAVTHYWVTETEVDQILSALQAILHTN